MQYVSYAENHPYLRWLKLPASVSRGFCVATGYGGFSCVELAAPFEAAEDSHACKVTLKVRLYRRCTRQQDWNMCAAQVSVDGAG